MIQDSENDRNSRSNAGSEDAAGWKYCLRVSSAAFFGTVLLELDIFNYRIGQCYITRWYQIHTLFGERESWGNFIEGVSSTLHNLRIGEYKSEVFTKEFADNQSLITLAVHCK